MDAFVSDEDGSASAELKLGQLAAARGEDLATAHLGNIAALAQVGLGKLKKSETWNSWFGGGGDGTEEGAAGGHSDSNHSAGHAQRDRP